MRQERHLQRMQTEPHSVIAEFTTTHSSHGRNTTGITLVLAAVEGTGKEPPIATSSERQEKPLNLELEDTKELGIRHQYISVP